MEVGMTIRRTLAGLIATVMFSVSSMAAACDLSCSFAQRRTDCHAQEAKRHSSPDASGRVDDMVMDGMAMPEMAIGENQMAVSASTKGMPAHPWIGEMGPCERQSCDRGSAVFARTVRSATPQLHLVFTPIEARLAARASPVFHDARDDLATPLPRDGSPLRVSLRI
jgi:hypothetical protein